MTPLSVFARSLYQKVCANNLSAAKRSFHLGISQVPTENVAEWFPEGFSARPDSINSLMNMIYTRSSSSVTPFNLFCRSTMERWTIKGLRIGNKDKGNRSVVIAAGMQACEHVPIGVALYAAAVLSQNPINGVEVTVFPVFKPKEFELQWHNEQTGRTREMLPHPSDAIRLTMEEYEWVVEGPLRSYASRRGANFVDFVMDVSEAGSSLHLKQNSLTRPFRQAGLLLQSIPHQSGSLAPKIAQEGERTLFEQLVAPPTIIIELRDKNKLVDEDYIATCAEELLTNIHTLVEETTTTTVL